MSRRCAQKLARLQAIVAERTAWTTELAQIKRLHGWLLEVEHLLDESLVPEGEVVSNETVGSRRDRWRERMATHLTAGSLSELERECLTAFLPVLSNLRPHLVQCYDRQDFPPHPTPTGSAACAGASTQSRRVSGRKNWNSYLLRYGRSVAYAAWWEQETVHRKLLEQRAARLDRARWRELRRQTAVAQSEQLTRLRFRNIRQPLLISLEERWAAAAQSAPLPRRFFSSTLFS